ncbi:DUF4367 domain-containing protein [Ferdinandcohnia sp. Marseille-Q9671]
MKNLESLEQDTLKDSIKSEYENAPLPPSSKEDTWLKIQQGFASSQKKKKMSKPSLLAASLFVTFILGTLVFENSQGDAFGWITKYFQKDNGTITQIEDSISQGEANSPTLPPPDTLQEIGTLTKEEIMSLSEAQEIADFHIVTPSELPDGYELLHVTVVYGENETSNDIMLNYNNQLTIQQINTVGDMGNALTVDNEDTNVQTVNVNGEKATLLTFKDDTTRLSFNYLKTKIIISGSLSEEELLSLAKSMK